MALDEHIAVPMAHFRLELHTRDDGQNWDEPGKRSYWGIYDVNTFRAQLGGPHATDQTILNFAGIALWTQLEARTGGAWQSPGQGKVISLILYNGWIYASSIARGPYKQYLLLHGEVNAPLWRRAVGNLYLDKSEQSEFHAEDGVYNLFEGINRPRGVYPAALRLMTIGRWANDPANMRQRALNLCSGRMPISCQGVANELGVTYWHNGAWKVWVAPVVANAAGAGGAAPGGGGGAGGAPPVQNGGGGVAPAGNAGGTAPAAQNGGAATGHGTNNNAPPVQNAAMRPSGGGSQAPVSRSTAPLPTNTGTQTPLRQNSTASVPGVDDSKSGGALAIRSKPAQTEAKTIALSPGNTGGNTKAPGSAYVRSDGKIVLPAMQPQGRPAPSDEPAAKAAKTESQADRNQKGVPGPGPVRSQSRERQSKI